MKTAVALLYWGAVAGIVCGCKEQRGERVAASYSSVTQPNDLSTAPAGLPEKMLVGVDTIPTEEDYEERAASSITAANLPSKLAELEKEMAF